MLKKIFAVSFLMLLMIGCATHPVKQAEPLPTWKIHSVEERTVTSISDTGVTKKFTVPEKEVVIILAEFDKESLNELIGITIQCKDINKLFQLIIDYSHTFNDCCVIS